MKKKIGTMDLILILLGAFLLAFTAAMTVIHVVTGSTPDTLITCVFGICGVEGGVMGWIKTSKNKLQKLNEKAENLNQQSKNINCGSSFCEEICEIMEESHE